MRDEDFDRWARTADQAMIAVSASAGGVVDVALVGFHSQSSIHPRQYTLWLSKKNRTTRLARRADVLGVTLLGEQHADLAAALGTVTEDDEPGKLDTVALHRHRCGAWLLDGAQAWFVGRVIRRLPGGDHQGFVLEPIAVSDHVIRRPLRLSDCARLSAGHPA